MAQPLAVTPREPLLAEIEAFVAAVRQRSVPVVSGAEGRRALALAVEVLSRIREHAQRAGSELSLE